jgi:hypothetical protein
VPAAQRKDARIADSLAVVALLLEESCGDG